jgi:hypothetical protein
VFRSPLTRGDLDVIARDAAATARVDRWRRGRQARLMNLATRERERYSTAMRCRSSHDADGISIEIVNAVIHGPVHAPEVFDDDEPFAKAFELARQVRWTSGSGGERISSRKRKRGKDRHGEGAHHSLSQGRTHHWREC